MSQIELEKIICVNLDDLIPYSHNFRWREALLLREWNMYVYPPADVYANIIKMTQKLEFIKSRFGGKPINITSFYRPEAFNNSINGAKNSAHTKGMAADFVIQTVGCDQARSELLPELERLGLRMEDKPGSNWIHCDVKDPMGGSRFFVP